MHGLSDALTDALGIDIFCQVQLRTESDVLCTSKFDSTGA